MNATSIDLNTNTNTNTTTLNSLYFNKESEKIKAVLRLYFEIVLIPNLDPNYLF